MRVGVSVTVRNRIRYDESSCFGWRPAYPIKAVCYSRRPALSIVSCWVIPTCCFG